MISRTDPRVRDFQRILGSKFGLGSQVNVDGDLGPRTWNGLTMVLGHGWWALSPDGVLAALGATSKTALPAYPFPERVRIAQSVLHIGTDSFLGPATWTALEKRLPSWKTRAWEKSVAGNIPDALGASSAEKAVIASAPIIDLHRQVSPDGKVDAIGLAEAMKKARAKGGTSAAAAADAADSAADAGLISQRQHDEVIATTPGLSTGVKVALAAAAIGGTYLFLSKNKRRSARA